MALPASGAPPTSSEVCSVFIDQYYSYLSQAPEYVHRFYKDSSTLSHEDCNGSMKSARTVQGINEYIMSADYKGCAIEIEYTYPQWSGKGVLILVTGFITKEDQVRRRFFQSFFLDAEGPATFFVLNDILKISCENRTVKGNQISADGALDTHLIPDSGCTTSNNDEEEIHNSTSTPEDSASLATQDATQIPDSGCSTSNNAKEEIVVPSIHSTHSETTSTPEDTASLATKNSTKSFAELVKDMAKVGFTSPNNAPVTTKVTLFPVNHAKPKPSVAAALPVKEPETVVSTGHEKGHSIYIRNLPLNTTADQIKEELKRFGTIKADGVQVRNHKIEQSCYAFVQFESQNSMQAAIESSPLTIGGNQVQIQEKRSRTRVPNGLPTSKVEFQHNSFRGRGGFAGNRSFPRSQFRNRGEYSGEAYQQRPVQNGEQCKLHTEKS